MEPKLLNVVALLEDVPDEGLWRGQMGTVVEILAPDAYLVEFILTNGHTYAMPALRSDRVMTLLPEPAMVA